MTIALGMGLVHVMKDEKQVSPGLVGIFRGTDLRGLIASWNNASSAQTVPQNGVELVVVDGNLGPDVRPGGNLVGYKFAEVSIMNGYQSLAGSGASPYQYLHAMAVKLRNDENLTAFRAYRVDLALDVFTNGAVGAGADGRSHVASLALHNTTPTQVLFSDIYEPQDARDYSVVEYWNGASTLLRTDAGVAFVSYDENTHGDFNRETVASRRAYGHVRYVEIDASSPPNASSQWAAGAWPLWPDTVGSYTARMAAAWSTARHPLQVEEQIGVFHAHANNLSNAVDVADSRLFE